MLIDRDMESELLQLLNEYPVVTILGPRQAGKTTLAKTITSDLSACPDTVYEYCNLETPENREFATHDPKAFLKQFKDKVVLDEIQRVPMLLSYIQTRVDENKINGEFILTGSHQLELKEAIGQSLAGRTGILNLLPFSIVELSNANIRFERFEDYAFQGFLPRIYDQKQRPTRAWSNYYQTYVERDVRLLIHLKDVSLFEKFIKLLAGRVGQIFNISSLANDVGVNAKTIGHWLSILEASFIIFKLPPYFENFGKRVIKSPKYYFIDVGLLVFLLGIEHPDQISRDPLVGGIFENMIVIELLKAQMNQGKLANLYYYRDSNGNEIDLLVQRERNLTAIEIKSGSTYHAGQFDPIDRIKQRTDKIAHSVLIYNGESRELSGNRRMLSFNQVALLTQSES
ncbi:MAG: ATP-binding protein [Mariprofundaceae bacterium]